MIFLDGTLITPIEPIFADLLKRIWYWKCLPQISQIYADVKFDGTLITQIELIFADLFELNLTLEMSPADFADLRRREV